MNIEESIQQIKTLIEAWQLDEADLNQTDINAMQVLLKENQELKSVIDEIREDLINAIEELQPNELVNGREILNNVLIELDKVKESDK